MPPRRHPLAGLCLGIVLGTAAGLHVPFGAAPLHVALPILFVGWAALWFAGRRKTVFRTLSAWTIPAIAFLLAFLRAQGTAVRQLDAIETFREIIVAGEDAVLRGRVATSPTVTPLPHGGARLRFALDVSSIPFEYDDIPIPGFRVRVDWYGPESMADDRPPFRIPAPGEGWQIAGRLSEVKTRSAVPLLVFRRSAHGRDLATRRAPELDASPLRLTLWRIRAEAACALGLGTERKYPTSVSLTRAMVLGYRSDIPPDVEDAFKASGTIHVFAISGLHVGLFAFALGGLLGKLGVPVRFRRAIIAPILILYVILTGARPSAIRACIMTLVAGGAILFGRKKDYITALWVAAAGILLAQPMQFLDLGFHFSFVCMAGLIVLTPVLTELLRPVAQPLRPAFRGLLEIPPPKPGGGMVRRWLRGRIRWIRVRIRGLLVQGPVVSLATWLVTVPLTAYCFGRLSPVAILCNIAVIPLAELTVVIALVSLAFAPFLPVVSVFANHLNALCTGLMTEISTRAAGLPYAAWQTDPWTPAAVCAWYVALVVFYCARRSRYNPFRYPAPKKHERSPIVRSRRFCYTRRMKRILFCLAVLSAMSAFAAGDLGPLIPNGQLFSKTMREMTFFQGERFAWVVKDKQMRFPAPGFTVGTLQLGETLVMFQDGKAAGLRISLYNRGDMGRLVDASQFSQKITDAAKGLENLYGKPGEKFERKTDPTKTVHNVEGIRWSTEGSAASLEWAVAPKKAGVGYEPQAEYLRLDILPAATAAKLAANPMQPSGRRVDPKSHILRGPDGVTELAGVPMVDQGAKGYCAAATVARIMGYYGLEFLDQHQIASWVSSDPRAGTNNEAMMDGLHKVLHDRYGLVYFELPCGKLNFQKLIEDYNKAAKSLKKQPIDLRLFAVNGVIHVADVWRTLDPAVLRKARCGNSSRNQVWIGEIRKSIDRGVPLVWSCMLGIIPETPALPQASGGHMRLIIGYTNDGRIVYTDSWGAGHERKFMKAEDAQLITTGLRTISWTAN